MSEPSPYLRQPILSPRDRALLIAARALERIGRDPDQSYARDELARIRTLCPEIDQ